MKHKLWPSLPSCLSILFFKVSCTSCLKNIRWSWVQGHASCIELTVCAECTVLLNKPCCQHQCFRTGFLLDSSKCCQFYFFIFWVLLFFEDACQIYWTGSRGGFVCPHTCGVGTEQMRAAWSSCAGDNLYQQQDSPLVPVHPPALCSSLLPVRFVCEWGCRYLPERTGWVPPAHRSLHNMLAHCREHFGCFTWDTFVSR